MRKTLLLFTTMAVALLLAAGMAGAALPAPTVVSTVPSGTTGVDPAADIRATFSEAMSTKSLGICNHCTSTTSSQTFYLLPGNFTALSPTKNPPRFCKNTATGTTAPCPTPITATVRYNAAGTPTAIPPNTAILDPSSTLQRNKPYTAVVEGTADGDYVAVKDADGTPMATDRIFSFTTAP
jgi:Bacterial Ig-like domain